MPRANGGDVARKYLFGPGNKNVGYGMEACEERLLIAVFLKIEPRIRADVAWPEDFRDRFYTAGQGVSDQHIRLINGELRRQHFDELPPVRETQMFHYGKETDRSWKAQKRCELRDEYIKLDTADQVKWVETALKEVVAQPPPHYTHDEYLARQEEFKDARNGLSPNEKQRREDAVANAANAAPKDTGMEEVATETQLVVLPNPQPTDISRTIRQLKLAATKLANKTETVSRIIDRLTPDDALTVAEADEMTDEAIIDLLLNRSMEA